MRLADLPGNQMLFSLPPKRTCQQAPGGVAIPLYKVAHCRTGDKGDQLNVSVIPHCREDITRLQAVITPEWVLQVVDLKNAGYFGICGEVQTTSPTLQAGETTVEASSRDKPMEVQIYHVEGVSSLNVVIQNVLDGGVTISRRLDRHGKALSDLFLMQSVVLGPIGD